MLFRPKVLAASIAILVGLAGAFAAGVAVAPSLWVLRDSLQSSRVSVNACPPPEGPLYEVDDFVRANDAAEEFLAGARRESRYGNLDLRYFATPRPSGYTLYYSTGNPRFLFPRELLREVGDVFKESLNGGQ